jgi:hypothetical protein
MNTRRDFFKQLAIAGAAVAAPSLFLPKIIKPDWKAVRLGSGVWTVEKVVYRVENPVWINAPNIVSAWEVVGPLGNQIPQFISVTGLSPKSSAG